MSVGRVRVQKAAWFLLAVMSLASVPVVTSLTVWGFVLLPLAGLALGFPGALLLRVTRRNRPGFSFRGTFLRVSLATTLTLTSLVGMSVYYWGYRAEADPLTVPLVTLVNGNRRVLIQGMVHVGSESFYESVVNDLEVALDDGYDLFMEGVQPADPEATEWFSETYAAGGNLSETYRSLSQACGVRFQLDYFPLLEAAQWQPERYIYADVSTRDMLDEWNRLNPGRAWAPAPRPLREEPKEIFGRTTFDHAIHWVSNGDRLRGAVAGIVCRGILSGVLDKPAESDVRSRIAVDFRNRHLVDRIVSHANDKVYVVFGAAHVPGVVDLLQQRDRSWQVASVKWVHALTVPRQLEALVESESTDTHPNGIGIDR